LWKSHHKKHIGARFIAPFFSPANCVSCQPAKRLCDVFDDELNRIAEEVGSRAKAFKLVKHDKKVVRFFLPLEPKNPDDPVWSIIRKLADKIGEQLTTLLFRAAPRQILEIVDEGPSGELREAGSKAETARYPFDIIPATGRSSAPLKESLFIQLLK